MILRFCEAILLKIRESQVLVAERVTSGHCNSHEDYKQLIGKLQGLKVSEELVQQAFKATFETTRLPEGVKEDGRTKGNEFY